MANALTLKSPLAANASVNEDDVIAAKTQLMNLGLYEAPEWGITGVPDRALFDAIRTFQRGTQLKTDGIMKPGGETETTLKTAAELVRRQGRNGDTILAHISPAEAELLHRVTDGGSINPETGLPEFFLGSMLGGLASSFVGSFAGPAAGSLVGSALSSFAAPVIGDYVSRKVGKKIGGPLGEIAGSTLGGYLGSGSLADIGGGLGQSFGNAVGGYAKRKVSQKIGGPLGDDIGDMLGSNLSGAVGGVASNGLTNAFGLETKSAPQPTAQPAPSPISDGVKDLLNPDFSSARTPGINPRDSRQSTARPTATTAPTLGTPTLGSPARTSPSKPQPQPQTPWLPPLLASEPRANTMEIKPDTPRPRAQTMEIKGKRPSLDLPAEILSSNARTANALMKTTDFSAIKPHIQDAWTNGGEQGRAEVMNLAQQMKDRNPEHGAKFEKDMGLKGTDALDFGPNPLDEKSRIGPGVQVADNSADAFEHLKTGRTTMTVESKKTAKSTNVDNGLFQRYRKNLAPREGGIADRPAHEDLGGLTNKGMSQMELNRLRKTDEWKHLPQSTRDLTDKQIDNVFRKEYFDKPQLGKLAQINGLEKTAPKLTEQIFDGGIVHGIDNPERWLQESLDETLGTDLQMKDKDGNASYDGVVGSQTRGAVERAVREGKLKEVNNRIVEKRIQYMRSLPAHKFNPGWIPRAKSFLMQ